MTAKKTAAKKTAAKKSTAKKAVAKRTATKKVVSPKPAGRPRIKVIQTIDRLANSKAGNPRFRVYFNDGTIAMIAEDAAANYDVQNPEYQAPNSVRVWTQRNQITYLEPVVPPAQA